MTNELPYRRKNGSHKHKQFIRRDGKILENIIDDRLNDYKFYHTKNNNAVFYTVAKNVMYQIEDSIYEIDNIIVRKFHNKKTVLLFEDKMGYHARKAHSQLSRHVDYIKNNFDVDKIYCFFCHNYYDKDKTYKVTRMKDLEWKK